MHYTLSQESEGSHLARDENFLTAEEILIREEPIYTFDIGNLPNKAPISPLAVQLASEEVAQVPVRRI